MKRDANLTTEPGRVARAVAFATFIIGCALIHFGLRRMTPTLASERADSLSDAIQEQYILRLTAEESARFVAEIRAALTPACHPWPGATAIVDETAGMTRQ